mgnify:CR=1 FL=1
MSKVIPVLFILLAACSETVTTSGACIEDNQCAYPRVCRSGACVVQCFLDTECIDGETCRFNRCVAPDVDAQTADADATLVDMTIDGSAVDDMAFELDAAMTLDALMDASRVVDAGDALDSAHDVMPSDEADVTALPDSSPDAMQPEPDAATPADLGLVEDATTVTDMSQVIDMADVEAMADGPPAPDGMTP